MPVPTQRIQHYIGESYTLVIDVDTDQVSDPADVTDGAFATLGVTVPYADMSLSFGTDLVRVNVLVTPTLFSALRPGTYPFDLSLEILNEWRIVSRGTITVDRAKSLGGS